MALVKKLILYFGLSSLTTGYVVFTVTNTNKNKYIDYMNIYGSFLCSISNVDSIYLMNLSLIWLYTSCYALYRKKLK